jgi:hypothetical protein
MPAAVRERLIEDRAIDDRGAHTLSVDGHLAAVGGDESRGMRGGENRMTGDVELVERVHAEKPRAVHRQADAFVLLENHNRVSAVGERTRGHQAGRAAADDNDVGQIADHTTQGAHGLRLNTSCHALPMCHAR